MNATELCKMVVSVICILPVVGLLPATYGLDNAIEIAAEIGFTPESAAAAGLEESLAHQALQRLKDAEVLRAEYVTAKDELDVAANVASKLAADVLVHPDDEQIAAEYASATAAVQDLSLQLESIWANLVELVVDGVPPAAVERLEAWRTSSAFAVPPEFRVVQRSTEEWRAIEAALRAEQRANRLGQLPPMQESQLLWAVRSDPEVIDAEFLMEANLSAVKAVFASFGD